MVIAGHSNDPAWQARDTTLADLRHVLDCFNTNSGNVLREIAIVARTDWQNLEALEVKYQSPSILRRGSSAAVQARHCWRVLAPQSDAGNLG